MHKVLTLGAIFAILAGCATVPSTGWHPSSKDEMERLIGETVMSAIHQYNTQLLKHQQQTSPKLQLKPKPINMGANGWH